MIRDSLEDSDALASLSDDGVPPGFGKVSEVWDILQRRHIDREELGVESMEEGAVKGILQALDDPHATYLNPDQFDIAQDDFSGQFSGIGAEVSTRNGRIMIHAPMPDTPAEEAGLRPGDIILSIDGTSTDGLSLGEAVALVRGEAGTPVELLVLHQDGGRTCNHHHRPGQHTGAQRQVPQLGRGNWPSAHLILHQQH